MVVSGDMEMVGKSRTKQDEVDTISVYPGMLS